jgi:predicted ATPase/DNA-binding SARP family transcriptional activator
MRFEILGPLRVSDGEHSLDLGGPRQQHVLACLLAATPTSLSVERIIEEVWGDAAPATASHVVRTYVSNLRRVLGDRLVSDGWHYQVALDGDPLDAEQFALLLDQGRGLMPTEQATAAGLLEGALALWRGRPFGDLIDSGPMVCRRAGELEEQRVQAVELLMEAQLALGHHDRVISRLRPMIGEHPFREHLHRQLMLALYRAGRQGEALQVGRDLRTTLSEELGIEPTAETRVLEDRILVQDPGLALRPPTNAPAFVSSFVGRTQEMADIRRLLLGTRLVTLVGTGGSGKTRLAREVAHGLLDRFPDGVWWVDLAPLGTSVAARTAGVLGLTAQPGVATESALERYLANRCALVVFDNCEHVADEVAGLATELLTAAEGLRVLSTSRRVLHAQGEVRYEVPLMSLTHGGVPGRSDAEQLFVERASTADPAFRAGPDALEDVARICRSLEGLPLAIEMAAARVATLTPAEIADRVGEPFRLLVNGPPAPARHSSLATALDWSYEHLTPEQQILFDRLSVLVGPFDLAAAQAVGGWTPPPGRPVLDDLTALVEASMLTHVRTREGLVRFGMLDTLRAYGRTRLADRRESDLTAGHHSHHFLDLVRRSAELRFTPAHPGALAQINACNDDLLVALDWSLSHEPRAVTLTASPGLVHYWIYRGEPEPAHRFGAAMLSGAGPKGSSGLAGAYMAEAFGSVLLGDPQRAAVAVGAALEILEVDDDWKLLLYAYNTLGQASVFTGQTEMIAAMGQRILDLCRSHDADLPRAYGLALLGEAEFFSDGDLEAAHRYLCEAIPLFRQLGDDQALNMFGLGMLAPVSALQGHFEEAERAALEASTLGGPGWSATALILLGMFVLHPRGDIDRAERVIKAGVERVHEHSMEVWVRCGLLGLGRIAADRERWPDAARLLGGCRPALPPWAQHSRWWTCEPTVRSALGDEAFDRIAAAAASESLDALATWATRT